MNLGIKRLSAMGLFWAASLVSGASQPTSSLEISCREDWTYPWNLRVELKREQGGWLLAELKTIYGEEYGPAQVQEMKHLKINSVLESVEGSHRILKVSGEGVSIVIDVTNDLSDPSVNETLLKNWFSARISNEMAQNKTGEPYREYEILCSVR